MGRRELNRRQFVGLTTAGIAGSVAGTADVPPEASAPDDWDPDRPCVVTGTALKVQPILMHTEFRPREASSWKSWGTIASREAAAAEGARIQKELATLTAEADFPLAIAPLATVSSAEEALALRTRDYDVALVYPATGSGTMLKACFPDKPDRDTVIFARHRSGPVYYWYEALSTRYLKKGTPEEIARNTIHDHGGVYVEDVVIDDLGEVCWRLRGLYAVKNLVGRRIVALGGTWGKYDDRAPAVARERYGLDIVEITYEDLAPRLEAALGDKDELTRAAARADRYLALPGTALETRRSFVVNAFLLYGVLRAWMRELDAAAFTIKECMSRALPVSQTTPCMVLSWLNDEGLLGFCESDFVVIPAGVLLHYASGTPVFLHNSTFPHGGVVTCAHCSAPRRMNGKTYEPARIMTHYESEYGAAPKVDMTVGQTVTFVDPEYATGRWLGFTGTIRHNPFLAICRTQQDVEIAGDWEALKNEVRDSHWMMTYGDRRREVGYAARKIGIDWVTI